MLLVLVTYTRNDADLLNGLLAGLGRWSVLPSHVFIIDDASEPPYRLPADLQARFGGSAAVSARGGAALEKGLPGVDVIRPGKHLGPAQAKSFGIGLAFDAGADVVLSIDSDVRLPKHWLKEAASMLEQPGVGLVGSDLEHGLAGDALSDYLREFEGVESGILDTQFLGAGVWLLRHDIWRESGGLSEYDRHTHEDLYFCNRLKKMGLTLIAHNSPPATQVRRLRASTYFNRNLRYLGFAIFGVAQSKGVATALGLIADQAAARLDTAERRGKPEYAYIELLWISALLFYLAGRGAMGNPSGAYRTVSAELLKLLQNFPRTAAMLQEDLAAMRLAGEGLQANLPEGNEPNARLAAENGSTEEAGPGVQIVQSLFGLWQKHPALFRQLEEEGVEKLRAEADGFSFSGHYLE